MLLLKIPLNKIKRHKVNLMLQPLRRSSFPSVLFKVLLLLLPLKDFATCTVLNASTKFILKASTTDKELNK